MADNFVQVPPQSTGLKVDTSELSVNAQTVERQRIVIAADATAAALAGVLNTSPSATSYGLAVRNIPRREAAISTTTTLGIGGVFTSAWQDGAADGSVFIESTSRADQSSAANGFVIEESDDDANSNFTKTVIQASVTLNTTTTVYGVIRARKWRIKYTNGGTGQGSFELVGTASVVPTYAIDANGNISAAIATALPAGANRIGKITVRNSADAADIDPLAESTFTGRINTQGQKTAAASTPVVVASDQSDIGVKQATAANLNATVVQATGTNLHAVIDTGSTTAVTQATAANLNAQAVGNIASASVDSGNPVKTGGVFNTTQPTVSNGQRVDAQMTSRGATIVAPGTEGFAVTGTVTTTPPANASTNVAQFGGTNVVTGTGAGGAGIPRVTVSSDSSLDVTDRAARVLGRSFLRNPGDTANMGDTTTPVQVQSNAANIATQATVATLLADSTFTGRVNTQGQKAMAASTPVVLPSDQSAIPVTLNAGSNNVGKVDVTSVIPGTAATNLGKAEDTPYTTGDVGVMLLAVRNDSASSLADANTDYAPLQLDATGNARVVDPATGTKDTTAPNYVNQIGGSDGTTLHAAYVDPAGNLGVAIRSMPPVILENPNDEAIRIEVVPGDGSFVIEGRLDATPVPVVLTPSPAQSWDKRAFYAQTTAIQQLKVGAGDLGGYYVYNPNASVAYIQFFDTASTVTLGTTRPDFSFGVPPGAAANLPMVSGVRFFNGIQIACTTTATGSTAPATGLDLNFWFK